MSQRVSRILLQKKSDHPQPPGGRSGCGLGDKSPPINDILGKPGAAQRQVSVCWPHRRFQTIFGGSVSTPPAHAEGLEDPIVFRVVKGARHLHFLSGQPTKRIRQVRSREGMEGEMAGWDAPFPPILPINLHASLIGNYISIALDGY